MMTNDEKAIESILREEAERRHLSQDEAVKRLAKNCQIVAREDADGRRLAVTIAGNEVTLSHAFLHAFARELAEINGAKSRIDKAVKPEPPKAESEVIDLTKLTPAQYRHLRRTQPEKLGLRPNYVNQQ